MISSNLKISGYTIILYLFLFIFIFIHSFHNVCDYSQYDIYSGDLYLYSLNEYYSSMQLMHFLIKKLNLIIAFKTLHTNKLINQIITNYN